MASYVEDGFSVGVAQFISGGQSLDKVGWQVGDVDLFEINEAFAVVAMAAAKEIGARSAAKRRKAIEKVIGWALRSAGSQYKMERIPGII